MFPPYEFPVSVACFAVPATLCIMAPSARRGTAHGGRGTTNLLLAVIAGVLLFGRDAMVGGLQGFFVIAIAVAVIWGLLALAAWAIRETVKAFREAKDWTEVAGVLFLIALCCIGMPMLAFAGWLWLEGAERPMNAAIDSWIGRAWMGVVVLLLGGFLVAGLGRALVWLRDNWRDWPDYAMLGLRGLGTMVVAPFVFPVREWRFKRQSGSGVVISFFSSARPNAARRT